MVAASIVLHSALPRFEWRTLNGPRVLLRIDRWTGRADEGVITGGTWVSRSELWARQNDQAKPASVKADSNLPVDKPIQRPADCSPEARERDPLVAIECTLTDPPEPTK